MMDNMARVSVNGQVTIPVEIRRILGLKEGDKVVFATKDGNVMLINSNRVAWKEFQEAMSGEAERVGWRTEDDIVDYCKQIRREMWEENKHDGRYD
jgi:AbrB family looped-hinge helix DNA binding protein